MRKEYEFFDFAEILDILMMAFFTTSVLMNFLHDFPTRQPPTWCCPSSYLTVGRRVYLRTVSRMFYGSSGAQSCRRTNGPNRHGLPVVYVVDKHSDHGYDYTHE
ncbi:uncharacterized protein LOC143305938 [Osmia lignaria lignaria]|uniref:uncharacterized protein LOC143305938 n=1 Tax=Osmia lignaria lignaria TaxID=1437193 RepID=UPI00402B0F64